MHTEYRRTCTLRDEVSGEGLLHEPPRGSPEVPGSYPVIDFRSRLIALKGVYGETLTSFRRMHQTLMKATRVETSRRMPS